MNNESEPHNFNIVIFYTIIDMSKFENLSQQIDEHIISCAIGIGCNKAELMRLASEYGNTSHHHYKFWNAKTPHALEEHEKKMALKLQEQVNDVILQQRRVYSELGPHGRIFKYRKNKNKPSPTTPTTPTTPTPTTRVSPTPRTQHKSRRSYCNVMGGKRGTNTKRRRN